MEKEISICSTDLAELILENKDLVGNCDWKIYVNEDGDLECRHNTLPSEGWYELIELYSFWDDEDTLNSTVKELANWLKYLNILPSDGIFDRVRDDDGNELIFSYACEK